MTELASLNVNVANTDPLYSPAAPSPEFLIADEESSSIYPLLTPSPSARLGFEHPLEIETNKVLAYEQELSPSSIDTDLSSLPAAGAIINPSEYCSLNTMSTSDKPEEKGVMLGHVLPTRNSLQSGMESSSSSSSVLQETTAASAQLLNSHHYHNLAGDVTCQENGGIKPTLCGIQMTIRKQPQDFYFVSWNWPLIRKFCFWGVMSMMVACICVIITYVTTLPSRCDPPRSWYQGSLIYEIFPGSFKDTNDDGIGDLKGIISKIDYLASIGTQSVRLNSIFPAQHYPEHFDSIQNFTRIERTLGTMDDFRLLVKRLHERNISMILDIPLYPFFQKLNPLDLNLSHKTRSYGELGNPDDKKHIIVNNHILKTQYIETGLMDRNITWDEDPGLITRILEFWLQENVDGFYMKHLENYVGDVDFSDHITEWKSVVRKYDKINGFEKILICSYTVVKELLHYDKLENNPKLWTILTHFNLIDIFIDNMLDVGGQVKAFQESVLLTNPSFPWPLWTTGSVDIGRLAGRLPHGNQTLAALALQLMFPGTPSLYYGDEVALDNIRDPNGERADIKHVHGLSPMVWSTQEDGKGFTHARVLPWVPQAKNYIQIIRAQKVISILSNIRENNPSIYMHAIWKDRQLNSNTAIRYSDPNIVLLERTYPRRNTYVIVANIGSLRAIKDLSSIFYGGLVVCDHEGNSGYLITFKQLVLNPGDFYLLKLDK